MIEICLDIIVLLKRCQWDRTPSSWKIHSLPKTPLPYFNATRSTSSIWTVWSTVTSSRMTTGVISLEEAPNQTVTFHRNFPLCLMARSTVHSGDHFGSYRHHLCQSTSHPKKGFSWCLLLENLFEASLQMFSVWCFARWKTMFRLLLCRDVGLNYFSLFTEHLFEK